MSPIFEINNCFDIDEVDEEYLEDFIEKIQEKAEYLLNDYGSLILNQKYFLDYSIDNKWYFRINRDYEIEYNICRDTDNTFRRKVTNFCNSLYYYFDCNDGIEIDLIYS